MFGFELAHCIDEDRRYRMARGGSWIGYKWFVCNTF
jgi:hypothetical protein